jgi:hypothetical protein
VSFWRSLKPWILKNNKKWLKDKTYFDEIEIAAELWKAEVSQVYKDREKIPPEQFYEIKYENFTASPISELKAALEFCELDWDKKVETYTKEKNIVNMNDRFKCRLNQKQVGQVESIIGDFVKNIGYKLKR